MTPAPFGAGTRKAANLAHEEIDLDAQIMAAEQAVLAGDERLRGEARQLIVRVREQAVQQFGYGLAIGGAGLLLSRLLRRSKRGASPLPTSSLSSVQGWSLARTLAMVWPLMPGGLRRAVPNGVPEILFGIVLPALGQLFLRRKEPQSGGELNQGSPFPPVQSAVQVDLHRYLGTWYEIARLPARFEKNCASNAMPTYGPFRQRGRISVLNQCQNAHGRRLSVHGVARVVEGYGNARLEVSFAPPLLRWLSRAWHAYWVLRVDGEYRHALVGTPDRANLWLLSRTPEIADSDLEWLIACANAQGFCTDKLQLTPQHH